MTVFIEDDAPVIVQGMTGHQGMTHTARMLKAGTNIVGGVNPRKAGTTVPFTMEDGTVRDIPVFATCQQWQSAIQASSFSCSIASNTVSVQTRWVPCGSARSPAT